MCYVPEHLGNVRASAYLILTTHPWRKVCVSSFSAEKNRPKERLRMCSRPQRWKMSDLLHTQLCRKSLLKQLNTLGTRKRDSGEKGRRSESWKKKAEGRERRGAAMAAWGLSQASEWKLTFSQEASDWVRLSSGSWARMEGPNPRVKCVKCLASGLHKDWTHLVHGGCSENVSLSVCLPRSHSSRLP